MTWETFRLAMRDFTHKNEYELDEYPILDGKKHRFAIICPGGGYTIVSNHTEGLPYAKRLNNLGYAAFVLRYRCKEKAAFPAPMEDLARALHDILYRAQELSLDTSCYSIWGSSAGGHLAASFGTERIGYLHYNLPKPGALLLCYPVVTMGALSHSTTRKNLLGTSPTDQMIQLTSVELQITNTYPPTFVWCGNADRTVSPQNSKMLVDALERHAIPYRYMTFDEIGHGVGLGTGTSCASWFHHGVQFWEAQMAEKHSSTSASE